MDVGKHHLAMYQPVSFSCPHDIVPSTAKLQTWKRQMTSNVWARCLDRVNVLGGDDYGHTGCVNALSWAQNGDLLISSGDDQQLRVWRMDHSSDTRNEYPFACQTVIETGHSANVFNAHMLPSSTRIATVAGDKQVRVFDVGESVGRSPSGNETRYSTRDACLRILRCHTRRTKRIITEDSPDFFLTVAEDGQVRQHDLRTQHSCARGQCPAPLFVVGGESPYAHLFDRRHIGRHLREEWGMSPAADDVTTCVRRFSRYSRAPGEAKGREHITGARMSSWNGHELLLSYNSDAVYLYSTRDEPGLTGNEKSCILPSNSEKARSPLKVDSGDRKDDERIQTTENSAEDEEVEMEADGFLADNESDSDGALMDESESEDGRRNMSAADMHPDVPVIYPRMRFAGHCNVETVKDVNYLGPCDEYVTSGSDDGNFFIWKKSSGELVDVLEGDGSVVNVIEGHPTFPLVAVSGIDSTIKLFAPARGPAAHSKFRNASSIIQRNARASKRNHSANLQLARLIMHHHERALELMRSADDEMGDSESRIAQCINQ